MRGLIIAFAASSAALAGCEVAESGRLGGLSVPDVGPAPSDAGVDAGPVAIDASSPDAGGPTPVDAGPPRCARETQAGECECSAVDAREPYARADCPNPEEVCIPWDLLTSRPDVRGAFRRCARPCEVEVDCPLGQTCADVGLSERSGARRICVDSVAGYDELCSGTRVLPREVVVPVSPQQPGIRVGCAEGYTCTRGVLEDAHIDEGVYITRCTSDAECAAPTPYCNPALLFDGAGAPGVCSVARMRRGAVCGPEAPGKLGFTSRCDTSPDTPAGTVCVQVEGLFTPGRGFCVTPCDFDAECPAPRSPSPTCTDFGGGFGICTDGCTNGPEDCPGPGDPGLGRVCMDYLGDGQGGRAGFCMDRLGPSLRMARLDATGMFVDPGDNCFAGAESEEFLRCPEPASCLVRDFRRGVGHCLYGCDPADPQLCVDQLGPGATCIDLSGGQPMSGATFCAGP